MIRKLFYRLVHKLGRNVDESMHVVAFLIWLERIRYSHNPVHKVIAWPFHLVDQLADEIAGFLRCLEREKVGSEYIYLFSVRKLCSRHIKLFEFHRRRNRILESVAKIVFEVCKRAFKDILISDREFVDVEGEKMWLDYINPGGFPQIGLGRNSGSSNIMAPADNVISVQEDRNADCSNMFGGMQLGKGCEDEPDVPPDDRTIFLTFCKGSYILESEIQEFFTRYYV